MRSSLVVLFLMLALLAALAPCQGENKEYSGIFENVWKKVNETYFDPAFGGLDWKAIHDRYQPLVAAAEKGEDFYRLVNSMLWELNVSHANLIPPGSFGLYEPLVFAQGSPGIDVRLLQGFIVISSIEPDSPAYKAGLRPGFVILALDGIPAEQIIKDATQKMPPPYNDRNRTSRITKRILGRIYGAPETEISLMVEDEGGKKIETKILRAKRNGVAVGPGGTIFFAIDFEARLLDNGIGYIRLNTLQPQFAAQISGAIKSMGTVRGIIFDLRGNSGGEIEEIPGLFLKERALFYIKRDRSGETKVFFDPAENAFKGPLVLLIDPLSGSASELFAAGLQAIGRAMVVGERSPGGVMESDMMVFPNGAVFMYPVAQMITPNGTVLEGHGVVPDIEVGLDRKMLLKGIDSQLDSAIKYLEKETRK